MGIKYQINSDFFKIWTPEMAYVLGFIFADGSLEDSSHIRGKYLRISNTDYIILRKIRNVLNSHHTIVKRLFIESKRKPCYLLRIGSHEIYNDLNQLGLYPRKSLNMQFPFVPLKYLSCFMRGYFDGDGSIMLRGKYGVKIAFTSGSLDFLKFLSEILSKNLQLKLQRVYISCRSYQLCYRTKESLEILRYIYRDNLKGLYLHRKYKIYTELLKRRIKKYNTSGPRTQAV